MKKNETKVVKSKQAAMRTKEQMEDHVFNKMMLWLAFSAVAEVVMLLVNRFYVHARVEELGAQMPIHHLLLGLFAAGIILFVAFLVWGIRIHQRGEWKDGTVQVALAFMFLCIGMGSILMRTYTTLAAPMVLAVIPGFAVLMLIFYLYQKEFFACGIIGGLCILGLWVFRTASGPAIYYAFTAVVAVLAIVGTALFVTLKKNGGTLTVKGKKCTLLQKNAAYPTFYITAVMTIVLLLVPLALGAAVAYYSIWIMAAWLFILAVYFTSKLM